MIKRVGIDDMAVYIPKLYLDLQDLAKVRNLEYAKLNKGLGLSKMSLPDFHEDIAVFGANAVIELIEKNEIHPSKMGRLYLSTESGLDASKPTATYILEMVVEYFKNKYGENSMCHCDVVDMKFACVAGVDALQNTLDWVRADTSRMGIVVASDFAKYELNSTGEYTQGAGAVAMLVKSNPRLIAFDNNWGISTKSVHDFFKPRRTISKKAIAKQVTDLLEIDGVENHEMSDTFLDVKENDIQIFRETPVFDGQYSNECFQSRIEEAFEHFCNISGRSTSESIIDRWDRLIFHLPYAFHAKRMFSVIYLNEYLRIGKWHELSNSLDLKLPNRNEFSSENEFLTAKKQYLRAITKTNHYKSFINEKIEKGQRASTEVGNIYTASIFLSLMGMLSAELDDNVELEGKSFGFLSYGSGSKSKVFSGIIQKEWKDVVRKMNLNEKLNNRKAISYQDYLDIHMGKLSKSIISKEGQLGLKRIEKEKGVLEGARYYSVI